MAGPSVGTVIEVFPGGRAVADAVRMGYDLKNAVRERVGITSDNLQDLARWLLSPKRPAAPIFLPDGYRLFQNPAANRERATRLARALESHMNRMVDDGDLFVLGGFSFHPTHEDPDVRINDIADQAGQLESGVVGAFGGDRTGVDAARGVWDAIQANSDNGFGPSIRVRPFPCGTANDLCDVTGGPSKLDVWLAGIFGMHRLVEMLGENTKVDVPILRYNLRMADGTTKRQKDVYGATGDKSGIMFRKIEQIKAKRKAEGKSVSVGRDYVPALPGVVWQARNPIYIKVKVNGRYLNDGKPFECGEFFLSVVGQFGGITKLPVVAGGATLFLPEKFPIGALGLMEVIGRKIGVALGFQALINWGGRVLLIKKDRQINLRLGDKLEMEFFNLDGSPREILITLSGDSEGPLVGLEAEMIGTVPFQCDKYCDMRVQQGLEKPRLPGDRITNNAVSESVNILTALANHVTSQAISGGANLVAQLTGGVLSTTGSITNTITGAFR